MNMKLGTFHQFVPGIHVCTGPDSTVGPFSCWGLKMPTFEGLPRDSRYAPKPDPARTSLGCG
jgi:hypothetical protein